MLLVFAAVLGLIAWRRRRIALVGISLLGVAGIAAAVYRAARCSTALPSLVAGAVGVLALLWMTTEGAAATERRLRSTPDRTTQLGEPESADLTASDIVGPSRPPPCPAAVCCSRWASPPPSPRWAGRGGIVLGRVRQAGSAARRAMGLPAPPRPPQPIPAGAQLDGHDSPFITPNDKFYRVDISLVTPRVDADDWTLTIDGMVDQPLTLTYDDLLQMPMIERNITLTCVSNEVGGPYVSTSKWLGVPFSRDHQAGRRTARGGPGLLLLLRLRLHLLDAVPGGQRRPRRHDRGRHERRGAARRARLPGPDAGARAVRLRLGHQVAGADRVHHLRQAQRLLDRPRVGHRRPDPDPEPDRPAQVARAPCPRTSRSSPASPGPSTAGIEKVEIRIDDGEWQEAKLADDAGIDLWRQWSFVYDGPAGCTAPRCGPPT